METKTKKDTGFYKYMDCSTAHIRKEDNDLLDECGTETLRSRHTESPHTFPITVIPHGYGWWLYVTGDTQLLEEDLQDERISEPIKAIMRKAHKKDAQWVLLDRDGFEHDDLETFNW